MKKFFAALLVTFTLLICQNTAQAVDVRLCDCTAEEVVSYLNRFANKFSIGLWGKHYYTYEGARRCELYFGNSDNNTIRLRLNNDNTVSRALVTIWFTNSSNFSDANRARDSFQEIQSSQFEKFSNVITDAAREEYKRRDDARELELRRYESQRADELSYPQSPERSRASQVSSTTTPQTSPRRELDKRATPSEFDRLDDFLPEADSPNTEVYVRRN